MAVILSAKLKNMILKEQSEGLEFYLKNIKLNGVNKGCSGFVKNVETGHIIYVTTEKSCYSPLSSKCMYRVAKDLKDYTGGLNQWAEDGNIASAIVKLAKIGGK